MKSLRPDYRAISIFTSVNAAFHSLTFNKIGRWFFWTTTAVVMCMALAGGWAFGLQIVGNVHIVEDGLVYRAAQLNGNRLAAVLKRYGIKSVVNLRGENHGSGWYDNEIDMTAAQGVSHFDVRMSALHEPNDAMISQLIQILRSAPRAILIHCASGSDRTGLASALYEKFVGKQSSDFASSQLSFRYGHFPWLGNRSIAMDHTFWRLADGGLPKVDDRAVQ